MNRRDIIRLGTYGAAGALVVPGSALAAVSVRGPEMAGSVYYTSDAPGRWSKKVSSHLPVIEIEKTPEGTDIRVETRHTVEGYHHYIVKHVLLDQEYKFLDEHLFDPTKDKHPVSMFHLDEESGAIHVLSVCNIHDTWMNTAEI